MANMVQAKKKIAILHRYPKDQIKATNAAFPYLLQQPMEMSFEPCVINYRYHPVDVLTFKTFDRLSSWKKFWKSVLWIFYAPILVTGRGYDVIYCDDSYPFYPALVKMASPRSKVVIRLGDLHLMYYYSGCVYKVLHFLEKIGWIMASKIIVISEAMARYIHKEIGIYPEVALDPVDPKDFDLQGKSDGTVMFHGVLTKNKNIDILLEAAEKMPLTDFVILGDGPEKSRLEKKAPRNVYFCGWVPFWEVKKYIVSCAVGVALRSDNPGNQYVVTSPFLQYGVMGKPCLVTRREVFEEYPWQFTKVDEMVQKLEKLLRRPEEEGRILQEHILKHHNAEKIAEKIWNLLNA